MKGEYDMILEIVRSFINLGKYLRIVKNWESID